MIFIFFGRGCPGVAAGVNGGAAPCSRRAHNHAMVIVGYNLHTAFTCRQRYKNILNIQAIRQGKMSEGGVGGSIAPTAIAP
jgi:hypothetical protein